MIRPAQTVFLLLDDFSHLAFSCAVEPLRIANRIAERKIYNWTLASPNGASATCSNGAVTLVSQGLEPLTRDDRLVVVAGEAVQRRASLPVMNYLRRERARGVQLGAICSGAYVLARAGLLNGIETAIHWEYHDLMAEEFPDVPVVDGVFATAGRIFTAAGGAAVADLMLHLIACDVGQDTATAVADQMVYSAARDGSAPQRASLQARHRVCNIHLLHAIRLMEENLETPLSPSEIAMRINISVRQLERLFSRSLHCTPKRYYLKLRLERAKILILQTELSIAEIAMASGFVSTSHFSKVFRHHFGYSPITKRNDMTLKIAS
ncbi:MAG: GlxA family transcriptional regulator, partial [Paracoccaceae bacterium]|nr:GlxA family transcriptional regulator [Paracoccaceae bacterium]